MKPNNWDHMSPNNKRNAALALLNSERGRFVIGQALAVAARTIKARPHPFKEVSNAEDMEMLGEELFSMGYQIARLKEYSNADR